MITSEVSGAMKWVQSCSTYSTLLAVLPTTLIFFIPSIWVQNEIHSRSVRWISKEASLHSLTDWNVGYRTGRKFSQIVLIPMIVSSLALHYLGEISFFYSLYKKHSCFYLDQLLISSSLSFYSPPLFQIIHSRSLAAHNSFIHSFNRSLIKTYYVPWTLSPFLRSLVRLSFYDFPLESDIVEGSGNWKGERVTWNGDGMQGKM